MTLHDASLYLPLGSLVFVNILSALRIKSSRLQNHKSTLRAYKILKGGRFTRIQQEHLARSGKHIHLAKTQKDDLQVYIEYNFTKTIV
jgi:hypothetical protein